MTVMNNSLAKTCKSELSTDVTRWLSWCPALCMFIAERSSPAFGPPAHTPLFNSLHRQQRPEQPTINPLSLLLHVSPGTGALPLTPITETSRIHDRPKDEVLDTKSPLVVLRSVRNGPTCHHSLRALPGNRPIMFTLRGRRLGFPRTRCQGPRLLS